MPPPNQNVKLRASRHCRWKGDPGEKAKAENQGEAVTRGEFVVVVSVADSVTVTVVVALELSALAILA